MPRCHLLILLSVVCFAALACGEEPSSGPSRDELHAEVVAAVEAEEWSVALSRARRALTTTGEDAEMHYFAAQAALQLNKLSETFVHLDQAEALRPTGKLEAQLAAVRGISAIKRYGELGAEADWSLASITLESGTQSGELRAESAYWLTVMQDMGEHHNDAKQAKFGKLFLSLEAETERAVKLRKYLTQKGLLP